MPDSSNEPTAAIRPDIDEELPAQTASELPSETVQEIPDAELPVNPPSARRKRPPVDRIRIGRIILLITAAVMAGFYAKLKMPILLSSLTLADGLNVVLVVATTALVVITAVYAGITAKTLGVLKEERLTEVEPMLYLRAHNEVTNPNEYFILKIENHGKGPAIRLRGYCIRPISESRHEVTDIKEFRDTLRVGQRQSVRLPFLRGDIERLSMRFRHDGFFIIRLSYEDARRNHYIYRLSLTVMSDYRGTSHEYTSIQSFSEKIWRIPHHERSFMFDNANPSIMVEHGRVPIFSRSLAGIGLPDYER